VDKSPVSDIRGTRIVVGLVPALYDKVIQDDISETVTEFDFWLAGSSIALIRITYVSDTKTEYERIR
jgi:hypothetical protein